MKHVLFLPNWKVHSLSEDSSQYQAPDKRVNGQPYWFFKYFPHDWQVDVLDFQQPNLITWLEKRLNIYIWQAILAFWKSSEYDVIISHGAQSGLFIALLRTITFTSKPLHLIFDIGAMNGGRTHWLENVLIKVALKSKPYIVCHSNIIIENYRNTYVDLLPRSVFIPFGVDIEDFAPVKSSAIKEPYVLAFGSAKRDYQTLLSAWQGINFPLRIVGNHSATSQPNVQMIPKVGIDELKQEIASALFVVVPLPVFNYSYGQMSFLQSMSMGKAVVVTRTPSSIDYIRNGEGAFFVEPYDAKDLHERILELLSNPDLLKQSSQQARQYVVANFSERNMAENLHFHLCTLLKTEFA